MKNDLVTWAVNLFLVSVLLVVLVLTTRSKVLTATERLDPAAAAAAARTDAPVASKSELEYCSDNLKEVLRRVLSSCGLIGAGRSGCKPDDIKNVARISGEDFNALFKPLAKRGAVLQFDAKQVELDGAAKAMIEKQWAEQRGGSYFFVVARASKDGSTEENRKFSFLRANSVMFFLKERFGATDPDIEKKVGLLYLGEEYAQLTSETCSWQFSRPGTTCRPEAELKPAEKVQQDKDLNRSAMVSWIDCRL
jgi:hypothetical protein